MTVQFEVLTPITTSVSPPETEFRSPPGTQAMAVVPYWGSLYAKEWSTQYIGSDTPGEGLLLEPQPPDFGFNLVFRPFGQSVPPYPYQSGVVMFPWRLAWYTQKRSSHISCVSIADFDLRGPEFGVQSISVFTCFTGNTGNLGQCYAVTAATYHSGDADADDPMLIALNLQKWTFPRVPKIATSGGESGLQIENLLGLGNIPNRTRIFFQAWDLGNAWELNVMTSTIDSPTGFFEYEFRGRFIDSSLGPGMPGMGANTWSSRAPFTAVGAYVGGLGPNDTEWEPFLNGTRAKFVNATDATASALTIRPFTEPLADASALTSHIRR